jgi:hypothetical protein
MFAAYKRDFGTSRALKDYNSFGRTQKGAQCPLMTHNGSRAADFSVLHNQKPTM